MAIVLDGTAGLTAPAATISGALQGTPVRGGLVSATAVTASGTSVDFTGIPSWAKRVTVMLSSVSTNGTSVYLVQLGDSGGVETTGYSATVSLVAPTDNTTRSAAYTSGFPLMWSVGASSSVVATMVFVKVNNNLWTGSGVQNDTGAAGGNFISGSKTLSDTLTQVRITTVNGTDAFDAGTINIMYEG